MNRIIKVGILPTTQIFEKDNPYNDIYTFHNIYMKKIYENGGIPVGILLNDGKLDVNSLEVCDAFLIEGGRKIEDYFLEVINYAIENNKPLLGICLGMQAIGVYSYLEKLLKQDNVVLTADNICRKFKQIKDDKIEFLELIDGHYNEKITRTNCQKNKHKIEINKNSRLYEIYQKEQIDVVSMHHYAVIKYGDRVIVNAISDNTIEGLEYRDNNLFILGVQWHPELEDEHDILFRELINKAKCGLEK